MIIDLSEVAVSTMLVTMFLLGMWTMKLMILGGWGGR